MDPVLVAPGTTSNTVTWPEVTATNATGASIPTTCWADLDNDINTPDIQVYSGITHFPLGNTTVTCIAIDPNDSTLKDECSFTVTISDLVCPIKMTSGPFTYSVGDSINATSPSGAVVSWPDAQVIDNADPDAKAECKDSSGRTSGDTFPIGEHTIVCTVEDAYGNKATCSFTFSVEPLCGDGDVDYVHPFEFPFNEECDGTDDCNGECTCCDVDIDCPLGEKKTIHWNCTEGMDVEPANSYGILGSTSCTDSENERSNIVPQVSCAYEHPTVESTKITRTWTVETASPCNKKAFCMQHIYINCPPADKDTRRLLQTILSEDDVNDWKPNPTSLRSATHFIKAPKTNN